ILDSAAGHLADLKAKMPASDGQKLEAHLQSLYELKEKVLKNIIATCDPDSLAPPDAIAYDDTAFLPQTLRAHIDVLVSSLACNVAQVATLQLTNSGGNGVKPFNWTSAEDQLTFSEPLHTNNADYHFQCHGDDGQTPYDADRLLVEQWMFAQLAYLLAALEAVPEGDGTLLDNTLVVYGKPMSWTPVNPHSWRDKLFLLAGAGNLGLQGGRYLELTDEPQHNLLVSICNLMGLSDVTSFGDGYATTGPLPL
ncbi:MAG: DUF1552 domain-containing protein, partial [Polyangiaceae bacterium]